MISEKSQYCNLQPKHSFDICLYSCILTYEFCSECQYKVENQSDVWKECFYLMKGNLEVHLEKNLHDIHATAQLLNITLQTRLSGDMIHLSCKLECQLKTDIIVNQLYVTILKFYMNFEPFVRICHILIENIEPLPFDTSISS